MTRPSISLRDVFTAGALVISVAALANSSSTLLEVGHAGSGSGKDRVDAAAIDPPAPRPDRQRAKNRRFGRVVASEFVLVDDRGRLRAQIGIDGSDVVRLRIGSEKTSESVVLSVFPNGRAAFLMKDDRGRNRATLAIAEDGRPFMSLDDRGSFCLDDARGQHRLVLRAHDDGKPEIWMDGATFSGLAD